MKITSTSIPSRMPRVLLPGLAALAIFSAALPSARSGVTTSANAQAPDAATVIAASESTENRNVYTMRWDSAASDPKHRDISQSFYVASDTTLASFTLKESHQSATTSALIDLSFTVKIYKVPSATALPDDAAAELLSTQTGIWTIPGLTAASTYITFELDQTVPLKADTFYAFVLGLDSGKASAGFQAATNIGGGTDYYPNGVGASLTYTWVDNTTAGTPGAWTVLTSGTSKGDYIFYANAAAAVPEPATTAALLGALAIAIASAVLALRNRN
ncbi:MAG: hypothetical protein LBK99_19955 [Opitutaceae bacterium]|jgi:hypothetical protein|nr:hypothetical protein [Opitutaceae bacterium]